MGAGSEHSAICPTDKEMDLLHLQEAREWEPARKRRCTTEEPLKETDDLLLSPLEPQEEESLEVLLDHVIEAEQKAFLRGEKTLFLLCEELEGRASDGEKATVAASYQSGVSELFDAATLAQLTSLATARFESTPDVLSKNRIVYTKDEHEFFYDLYLRGCEAGLSPIDVHKSLVSKDVSEIYHRFKIQTVNVFAKKNNLPPPKRDPNVDAHKNNKKRKLSCSFAHI